MFNMPSPPLQMDSWPKRLETLIAYLFVILEKIGTIFILVYQSNFQMSQPIINKVFYFNNKKAQQKIKNFQNIFNKKINFTV